MWPFQRRKMFLLQWLLIIFFFNRSQSFQKVRTGFRLHKHFLLEKRSHRRITTDHYQLWATKSNENNPLLLSSFPISIPSISGTDVWDRIQSLFQKKNLSTSSPSLSSSSSSSSSFLINSTTPLLLEKDIVIVGGGIAGLSCLKSILSEGTSGSSSPALVPSLLLLEQADRVGGRIFTENINGFLLDYGFQVFLDQYPNSLKVFNYTSLQLHRFLPGAFVHKNNQFYSVFDPFRFPQKLLDSLLNPIGNIFDKFIVGLMTIFIRARSLNEIYTSEDVNTKDFLSNIQGLSDGMVDSFFRPFYQGIFLSPLELQSSRMFQFVFKMFAEGSACLPANGMGEIPNQIAASVPSDTIKLNHRVEKIQNFNDKYELFTTDTVTGIKTKIVATKVILACDPLNTANLIAQSKRLTIPSDITIPEGRGSTCLYFAIDGNPPIQDPILILNGENQLNLNEFSQTMSERTIDYADVRINNVCFPNLIASNYAPEGKSLASITIVGYLPKEKISDEKLETFVRFQLEDWWDKSLIANWKLLKIYRIPYAQPKQFIPTRFLSSSSYSTGLKEEDNNLNKKKKYEVGSNLYVIGDYRSNPTLNGAIETGIDVGKLILSERRKKLKEDNSQQWDVENINIQR